MREGGCTVQAVAVCSTGLWLMGSYLVVKLLGGRVQSWWCRHDVGGTVQAVAVQ